MIYIGIDPGAGGGIAFLDEGPPGKGWPLGVIAIKMPATEADIFGLIKDCPGRAVIEHVWSIPGQGGAFAFGKNVGALLMALTAAKIPFDQALPRRWQKELGVAYPAGATDTEKKNITKRRAQALFPGVPITHAIADALLIAEYCRRLHRGSHVQEKGAAQGGTEEEGSGRRQGPGKGRRRSRAEETAPTADARGDAARAERAPR
jgi:hypothetical protein